MIKKNAFSAACLCGTLLLLPLLSGCGGSSKQSATAGGTALSGTILSAAGLPLAGYRVAYSQTSDLAPGQGSGITTFTDANGRFTLRVPASQITGHDTISVYDLTGSLVNTTAAEPGSTVTVAVHPPVPPVPPPGT